ncbi:MAG: hypothetical protein B7733_09880 [Myxococcales bacterium FL481]|nr:MAG: hypothetical protein B7733_09880 [Myxococcales bacterium FL481]
MFTEPSEIATVLSKLERLGRLVDAGHAAYWVPYQSGEAMPSVIQRVRQRVHRRVPVSRRVLFVCAHPTRTGEELAVPLRDVSMGGLSFWGPSDRAALRPGVRLHGVLRWKAGIDLPVELVVRHATSIERGTPIAIGCELPKRPKVFRDAVDRLLHPRSQCCRADPHGLWNLFEESGYLSLSGKNAADFDDLRRHFFEAERTLRPYPELCGVFSAEGQAGLDAAMAQVRMWQDSWLIYHVARSRRPRLFSDGRHQPLVDVYTHAYEHVLEHSAKWLVTYVQRAAEWSKFIHRDICEPWLNSGLASITGFSAWEVSSLGGCCAQSEFDVRPALPSEFDLIEQHLRQVRPASYIEGTGLTARELANRLACKLWEERGVPRKQEVLVAWRGGRPLAFAVLDATPVGLHLYRLTQTCRVFGFVPLERPLLACLLDAAAVWFRCRDITRFIYFDEEGQPPEGTSRARDLGPGWTTIVSAQLVHEYIEHIIDFTTPVHPLLE